MENERLDTSSSSCIEVLHLHTTTALSFVFQMLSLQPSLVTDARTSEEKSEMDKKSEKRRERERAGEREREREREIERDRQRHRKEM